MALIDEVAAARRRARADRGPQGPRRTRWCWPRSAKHDEVDHYLDLLDARDLADGWTTSADVERTKPEPDLVAAALEKVGGGDGA